MPATKIATCSYCGTRAALVLTGDQRHELTCSSCGAQLHDLKMLPKRSAKEEAALHHRAKGGVSSHERAMSRPSEGKRKKSKKKKSFGQWALSELWDVVEDIID